MSFDELLQILDCESVFEFWFGIGALICGIIISITAIYLANKY